jgi:hypothetical protein
MLGLSGGGYKGVEVHDQGFGAFAGKLIMLPKLNGVRGASIFTQAAKQASGQIDVENQGPAIALLILEGNDFDTIAWANYSTQLATDAFDLAVFVGIQEMVTAITFEGNPFLLIGILFGDGS